MVTHSSILAWKIPWTGEPCGLQSMRSQRVEPKWAHTQTSPSLWAAPGLWHHHTHRLVSIGILKGNLLSLSFSCFVRWFFFPFGGTVFLFSHSPSEGLSSFHKINLKLCTYIHSNMTHNTQKVEAAQCLLRDEWINKLWSLAAMEYYSALKRKQMLTS